MIVGLLAALVAATFAVPAIAQQGEEPFVAQEFLKPRLRSGNAIVFCQSSASSLLAFERDVATELAARLLVQAEFHVMPYPYRQIPHDYGLGYGETEVFMALVNDCDAMLGIVLDTDAVPDWMQVTRSYLSTRYVFASTAEAVSIDELPAGTAIGTRFASGADVFFSAYLREAEGSERFRRVPLAEFAAEMAALCAGEVGAILIWEPALTLARKADPELCAMRVLEPGRFTPPAVAFGMGLRSNGDFLRTELDAAIASLAQSGIIERLAVEHGLR